MIHALVVVGKNIRNAVERNKKFDDLNSTVLDSHSCIVGR